MSLVSSIRLLIDYFYLFVVMSLVSSILTLTLIACDRFFGIMFAMRAHLTGRGSHRLPLLVAVSIFTVTEGNSKVSEFLNGLLSIKLTMVF